MAETSGKAEKLDPSAVNSVEELATALDVLRRRCGLSYEAMDKAAAQLVSVDKRRWDSLGKSTVGEIVKGKRPPTLRKLRTFLAVCDVPPKEFQAWEAALQRASTAKLIRPTGAIRVARTHPRALGVHAAIDAGDAPSELPIYIGRDMDEKVRATLSESARSGGFVLLVGRSSVGKTRSLYEAVLAIFPGAWLVHPDPDQRQTFEELTHATFPGTVVWLDELQRYIDGACGLSAGLIRALLRARVVVVGTMWSDEYLARTAYHAGPDREHALLSSRELLAMAEIIDVADSLSEGEKGRASVHAASDRRIRIALETTDTGVIQVLAAGPALIRRWLQAPDPYAQAVITAAVDVRRIGINSTISKELLVAAVPAYLTSAEQARSPADWLTSALNYGTATVEGAASALTPLSSSMGVTDGYMAADILLQHGHETRRNIALPAGVLDAIVDHFTLHGKAFGLARLAHDHMQIAVAEQFYRAALATDDTVAMPYSDLLIEQGRLDDAIAVLTPRIVPFDPTAIHPLEYVPDRHVAWRVADLLLATGKLDAAIAVLKPRADAGDWMVKSRLAELYYEHNRIEDLKQYADRDTAGGEVARKRLDELLIRRGDLDEVLEFWRGPAAEGDGHAQYRLAGLLAQHGKIDELRAMVESGGYGAAISLAWYLDEHGLTDEAMELLQHAPSVDHDDFIMTMADLLDKQGRYQEALELLAGARTTDPSALDAIMTRRVNILVKQGNTHTAIELLHQELEVVGGKDYGIADTLAMLLARTERFSELEERARGGSRTATQMMIVLSVKSGDVVKALSLLDTLGPSGRPFTEAVILDALAEANNIEELRVAVRVGFPGAAKRLARLERRHTRKQPISFVN